MKHIEPRCICLGNICGGGYEKNIEQSRRVYDSQGLCPTLPAHISVDSIIKTMEMNDAKKMRIRRLTPKEYWRVMDFDDEDYNKASEVVSETQLYKQAGNSIVVNCLVAIFGQMFEGKEDVYKDK